MIDAARLVALLGEGCSTAHGAAVGAEVVPTPCAKAVLLHAVVLDKRITEVTTVVAVVFAAASRWLVSQCGATSSGIIFIVARRSESSELLPEKGLARTGRFLGS